MNTVILTTKLERSRKYKIIWNVLCLYFGVSINGLSSWCWWEMGSKHFPSSLIEIIL